MATLTVRACTVVDDCQAAISEVAVRVKDQSGKIRLMDDVSIDNGRLEHRPMNGRGVGQFQLCEGE